MSALVELTHEGNYLPLAERQKKEEELLSLAHQQQALWYLPGARKFKLQQQALVRRTGGIGNPAVARPLPCM